MFKEVKRNEIPINKEVSLGERVKPVFFDKLIDEVKNIEEEIAPVVQNKLDGCRRENEVERE